MNDITFTILANLIGLFSMCLMLGAFVGLIGALAFVAIVVPIAKTVGYILAKIGLGRPLN